MERELSDDNSPTEKTQGRYKCIYDTFVKWKKKNGFESFDEDVLLMYFKNASKTYKSSTLQSMYSILRRMFILYDNVDISPYKRLLDLLKEHHARYVRTEGKVFTAEEINRFMVEAPDDEYLAMKAIMVFGVTGGYRCEELQNIKVDQVKDCGTEIIVNAPRNRRTLPEIFLISGDFAQIIRRYMQLRPAKLTTDRFFLQYSHGKCENAVIGRNKFGSVPKEIANFLKLDDYKFYTGHSFQVSNLKRQRRQRRWKEAKVVETELQNYQNVATPSDTLKRPAIASKSDPSKRLVASTNSKTPDDTIVKPEYDETAEDLFYDVRTSNRHRSEESDEPFVPMLPVTMSLMKRKSKYYLGLLPMQFLQLLQVVGERKLMSDVKFVLTLRKLRLNEEFETLGDAFDMDRATAEKCYNESKHAVLDLVDGGAPMTNQFNVITEPIIKIEQCDSPYVPDPIAFENDDDDYSTSEMNADDHDDVENTLPECSSDEDRGFLSHELKRRTAECTVCHKFFVPRLLNSHMDSHFNLGNLNRTICGLCWKEFAAEKLLRAHQKDAHGGGSCCCDICGKLFASKRYIMAHILQRHALVKTFLCDTCGEGFPVPYLLLDHNKRKHNAPAHACHLCDMKFVQALSLKDHIVARHTNERPYVCQVKGCGKSFSWPSSFKSHKRVHADANDKFECPICFKGFSFKGNLRNHLKTMHNEIVDNQHLTIKSI